MANVLQSVTDLLKRCLEGDPPPPALVATLGPRLDQLMAVSVDPSGAGIDRWVSQFRALVGDERLRDTLVVRAVQMTVPRLAETLVLVGVVEVEWDPGDASRPTAFRIRRDRLDALLSDPGGAALQLLLGRVQKLEDVKALQVLVLLLVSSPQALLELEYRQQGFAGLPLDGTPGISSDELLALVDALVNSPVRLPLPVPAAFDLDDFEAAAGPAAPEGTAGSITLDGPDAFDGLRDLALDLHLRDVAALAARRVDLGSGWVLSFVPVGTGDQHHRLRFDADHLDPTVPRAELGLFVGKQPADADALLVGDLAGTHLAVEAARFGLQLRTSGPLFDVVVALDGIEFVLVPDFLGFISFGLDVPAALRFRSDVRISYAQGQGLTGQSDVGAAIGLSMEFATPIDLRMGGAGAGVELDQVVTHLDVALDGGRLLFRVLFRYSANAELGPLSAVMDGAGAWIGRWTTGTGGLLPPRGIGLSLDAGPVDGGGFLEVISDREFAGGLQLKILGVGAFAYGFYEALPSGDPSVVVLIGIRLPLPGVQLGFGFAVSGFGGLVGINRRADTDVLRERLASGAAGDVLFNDDPMKNAPKLLGDMARFFPDEAGVFLIGPTLQVSWASILTLDLGLFIELPGPRKIFLAGSARLVLGSEEFALVYLRMDFVGGVDLTRSLIFFDAALVNSHVLGIFRITGGVALRISYGANGYFLFTVGGFHPSFHPGAMELPQVARVGVSVSLGPVWLKQEMYLAITSTTFQLGSRTEAGIEIGPISAHGWFGFDALIQFKPFWFVASVDAGFDVEVAGVSLCSVRVSGELSGPGPLVLKARASVRLLFVKVSGNVTLELSSNPPEHVVTIPHLPRHLQEELVTPDNLRMEGEDPAVVLAPQDGPATLVSPVGQLIWEQKRAPLALAIQKVEGVHLDGWHTLRVSAGLGAGLEQPEHDWFGVGTYLTMGDSEALNTSRFVEQQSGLRVGALEVRRSTVESTAITLHLVKLPVLVKIPIVSTLYVGAALAALLGERAAGAVLTPGAAKVAVEQETFDVHAGRAGGPVAVQLNEAQAFASARRDGGISVAAAVPALDLSGVV